MKDNIKDQTQLSYNPKFLSYKLNPRNYLSILSLM